MGGASRTVNLLADDFISSSSITTENLVLSPNVLQTDWLYKLRLDVEAEPTFYSHSTFSRST